MKRVKLIALILILLIFYLILFPYSVNANTIAKTDYLEPGTSKTDDLYGIIDPDDYEPGTLKQEELGRLPSITGNILATIKNIGIIIAVIILSIIGLKYIFGSLEEKAEYKENMTLYVIGCFLLAMATTIPSIIYDIIN